MSLFEIFFGFNILVFINLILLCGNIEENLQPKTERNGNLSVMPLKCK